MTTETKITISISGVSPTTKKKLETLAEKDRRTFSAYVSMLLDLHVQALEAFDVSDSNTRKARVLS